MREETHENDEVFVFVQSPEAEGLLPVDDQTGKAVVTVTLEQIACGFKVQTMSGVLLKGWGGCGVVTPGLLFGALCPNTKNAANQNLDSKSSFQVEYDSSR